MGARQGLDVRLSEILLYGLSDREADRRGETDGGDDKGQKNRGMIFMLVTSTTQAACRTDHVILHHRRFGDPDRPA